MFDGMICREIQLPARRMLRKYQRRSLTMWNPMKGITLVPLHSHHVIYEEEEVYFLSLLWKFPFSHCQQFCLWTVSNNDYPLQQGPISVNLLSMTSTMKMKNGLKTSTMSGKISTLKSKKTLQICALLSSESCLESYFQ
jgi:hypothetical protein